MKSAREIEILFRRLRLYDQLDRRAEGLIRTIQKELKERYVNRGGVRLGRKTARVRSR